MAYHISDDGVPRRCTAKPGNCHYATEEDHYETYAEAAQAYENQNYDNLIPVHSLITNEIDDVFEDDDEDDLMVIDGLTQMEDQVVEELTVVEGMIEIHQDGVMKGVDPYKLTNISAPLSGSEGYLNDGTLKLAWDNSKYDEVRRIYAEAYSRKYGALGAVRLTPDDLVYESKKRPSYRP